MFIRTLALLILPATLFAAPQIRLEPPLLQLGEIGQQEVFEREVLVLNLGDETLRIDEVSTSCPCTYPEMPEREIAPGGSALLTITFSSKDYQGEIDKIVEIASNDPERSLIEFPVRAFIAAPIMVDPADRHLNFGRVKNGSAPSLTARFEAEASLEIRILESPEELLLASVKPGNQALNAELEVQLRPDIPAGAFRGLIRLETNAEKMKEIDIEISGLVEAELMADPLRVNFRMVKPGQTLEKTLQIKSSGRKFRVLSAQIDLPGLEAELLSDTASLKQGIRIYGKSLAKDDPGAKKKRGRMRGALKIHTDHPDQPEIKVDVLYMMRI
ncbi:MAG: DUF1573 domain-containing protein [Candidatus Krumholzibacteria bacterium]|jgi:hypothetical protein|nr:DUF1573 domain-containing protein [Candidatus Krumholzibacteria bacterium]MDP6797446.1 DUF1573 domain-containing protein [Candidatus Krumholzibacteria bacterium]MDP7022149.1 DUF1573 domain-containing protein [Candidatus Krumholzibacteria bacterium]